MTQDGKTVLKQEAAENRIEESADGLLKASNPPYKKKTTVINGKSINVQSDLSYIEEGKDNVYSILHSLEKVLQGDSRKVFIDSCVFHSPANYWVTRDPQEMEIDILDRSHRFRQGILQILGKYEKIALIENVVGELKRMREVEKTAFNFVMGKFHEQKNPALERIHDLVKEDYSVSDTLFDAIGRKRYFTREGGREVVFNSLLDLVKLLDKAFELKKPESKSDTDERIVAAALTEAVLSQAPVAVISRDRDIFNLLRTGYNALDLPTVRYALSLENNIELREARYLGNTGIYSVNELDTGITGSQLAHALDPRILRKIALRMKSAHDSLDEASIDESPLEYKIRKRIENAKNRVEPSSIVISSHYKKRKTKPEGEEFEQPLQRKTIAKSGHSISVREQNYRFFNGDYKSSRRFRICTTRRFSRSFMKEFGHILRDKRYQPKPETERKVQVLNNISSFIDNIIPKYNEVNDSEVIRRQRNYGMRLAEQFLSNESYKINSNEMHEYCKGFIEYGLFLRSLSGEKFISVSIDDFLECAADNGALNAEQLREKSLELEKEFRIKMTEKKTRAKSKKIDFSTPFDRFIAYRIVPRSNMEDEKLVKQCIAAGKTLLDEAVIKYGVDASNANHFLQLMIQHVDWGIAEAGNITITPRFLSEKLNIYNSDEERKHVMGSPTDTLYLVSDIFEKMRVKDTESIFRGLNESGALPLITKRNERYGYFVNQEGAGKIIQYFDKLNAINYREIRSGE